MKTLADDIYKITIEKCHPWRLMDKKEFVVTLASRNWKGYHKFYVDRDDLIKLARSRTMKHLSKSKTDRELWKLRAKPLVKNPEPIVSQEK